MRRELVFCLEEESARILIESVLEKVIPQNEPLGIEYIVFRGKQDLEKRLTKRIRAWQNKDAVFIILRDQDAEPDCKKLKARLLDLCSQAGCNQAGPRPALVRIVCRTLESWYLGDLQAVGQAYGHTALGEQQGKEKFRNPDRLHHPDKELAMLLNAPITKMKWAERISPHLDPHATRSPSFAAFVSGLSRVAVPCP